MAEAIAAIVAGSAPDAEQEAASRHSSKEDSTDNLGTLIQWTEDSEEMSRDAAKAAERDRDYYDGKQLTSTELQALKDRGQPDNINNEIQRKVDFLTGFEASQRSDPKAFPRNPDDEEAAEAATDMLRFQEQSSDIDQFFSDVWEYMMVEGFGGVEVLGPSASNKNVIEVLLWHWDRLFYDPHSRKHDFSDARYRGGYMWMDSEEAKANPKWAGKGQIIDSTVSNEAINSQTHDDRPSFSWALRGKRNRVRIVQIDYKDGEQIKRCTFCKGGKLSEEVIEFVDENGDPDEPMIMQSAYVDRQNNRYGIVRQLIGPQDEVNKRASKALHLLTVRGGIYEDGAIGDVAAFKKERAKADGMAKVNPGGMNRLKLDERSGEVQGNLELLREAKLAIQLKGPNAALQGKQEAGASGRAIRASQEGGIIEMARLRDRHRHFKRRVYRAIWNRCRQFLTEETWVRVTDNDKNIRFAGFNRPLTFAEAASKELEKKGAPPEAIAQAVPLLAQELGLPSPDFVIGTTNVLADMDMDIILEDATEAVNVQEEQFEGLVQLASAGVQFPPAVYIKASSLRNKDELIEMLPKPDPAAVEMGTAAAKAEIEKTLSEVLKNRTQAALNEANADAKRVDAARNLVTPVEVPALPANTMSDAAPLAPAPSPQEAMPGDGLDPNAPPGPPPEPFEATPLTDVLPAPQDGAFSLPGDAPATGVI